MPEATVIVRVDDGLKAAFTEAAKAADRTTSQLLRDFMRDYVRQQGELAAYEAWLHEKVEAGRAAVRDGRTRSAGEAEAYFARRRAESLNKADASGR